MNAKGLAFAEAEITFAWPSETCLSSLMPLQNRMTPLGDIIAHSGRGSFMGNRGILHAPDQRLGKARWRHPHWVTCVLVYKDWHREVMQPNNYTELFFLDEATALAAGHRPCALCRRKDYDAFQRALCDGAAPRGQLGRGCP